MAFFTQVFAQGQENEGELGKGKQQAVDQGKRPMMSNLRLETHVW